MAKEGGANLDHAVNDTFNPSIKEMQLPKFDCIMTDMKYPQFGMAAFISNK
ncbi:MAG: hypothetical protein ABJA76_21995 [Mucilaginibacter sp.]